MSSGRTWKKLAIREKPTDFPFEFDASYFAAPSSCMEEAESANDSSCTDSLDAEVTSTIPHQISSQQPPIEKRNGVQPSCTESNESTQENLVHSKSFDYRLDEVDRDNDFEPSKFCIVWQDESILRTLRLDTPESPVEKNGADKDGDHDSYTDDAPRTRPSSAFPTRMRTNMLPVAPRPPSALSLQCERACRQNRSCARGRTFATPRRTRPTSGFVARAARGTKSAQVRRPTRPHKRTTDKQRSTLLFVIGRSASVSSDRSTTLPESMPSTSELSNDQMSNRQSSNMSLTSLLAPYLDPDYNIKTTTNDELLEPTAAKKKERNPMRTRTRAPTRRGHMAYAMKRPRTAPTRTERCASISTSSAHSNTRNTETASPRKPLPPARRWRSRPSSSRPHSTASTVSQSRLPPEIPDPFVGDNLRRTHQCANVSDAYNQSILGTVVVQPRNAPLSLHGRNIPTCLFGKSRQPRLLDPGSLFGEKSPATHSAGPASVQQQLVAYCPPSAPLRSAVISKHTPSRDRVLAQTHPGPADYDVQSGLRVTGTRLIGASKAYRRATGAMRSETPRFIDSPSLRPRSACVDRTTPCAADMSRIVRSLVRRAKADAAAKAALAEQRAHEKEAQQQQDEAARAAALEAAAGKLHEDRSPQTACSPSSETLQSSVAIEKRNQPLAMHEIQQRAEAEVLREIFERHRQEELHESTGTYLSVPQPQHRTQAPTDESQPYPKHRKRTSFFEDTYQQSRKDPVQRYERRVHVQLQRDRRESKMQERWLKVFALTSRVQCMVDSLRKRRADAICAFTETHASQVIQRYVRSWLIRHRTAKEKYAAQVICNSAKQFLDRRRRRRCRAAATLIVAFLRDRADMARVHSPLAIFHHRIRIVQRWWRKYSVFRRAQREILRRQFERPLQGMELVYRHMEAWETFRKACKVSMQRTLTESRVTSTLQVGAKLAPVETMRASLFAVLPKHARQTMMRLIDSIASPSFSSNIADRAIGNRFIARKRHHIHQLTLFHVDTQARDSKSPSALSRPRLNLHVTVAEATDLAREVIQLTSAHTTAHERIRLRSALHFLHNVVQHQSLSSYPQREQVRQFLHGESHTLADTSSVTTDDGGA